MPAAGKVKKSLFFKGRDTTEVRKPLLVTIDFYESQVFPIFFQTCSLSKKLLLIESMVSSMYRYSIHHVVLPAFSPSSSSSRRWQPRDPQDLRAHILYKAVVALYHGLEDAVLCYYCCDPRYPPLPAYNQWQL